VSAVAALLLAFLPRVASAQELPAKPMESAPLPDAVFAAIRDQEVVLTMRTGANVSAVVLASEGDTLILAIAPGGRIVGVPKADVSSVRLKLTPPRAEVSWPDPDDFRHPSAPAPLPPTTRYVGLSLTLPPAVTVDVVYGYFLGFASVSVLLPFLTSTNGVEFECAGRCTPENAFGGTTHLWAYTLGAGATFPVSDTSRWRFDLFAVGGGSNWSPGSNLSEAYGAVGMGFGFHVTLDTGFTFAVRAPLVGGAFGSSTSSGGAGAVGAYFVYSLVGLPLMSLGYRF
jgi:hypothetical protein